ncbi:hypothetical protein [Nocardiopsis aegyptia]|uniref:Uncharacterized protein n=1 Tax=Nocardiopsis aegyptia TaxID=220378 RepID=A0A7Z0EJW8_9ACTN|nr:hypothetical protein [Nocardiopsis aegyptia]NYJ33455.1 hypothetical protein [Nocardiopsis aegyptia]
MDEKDIDENQDLDEDEILLGDLTNVVIDFAYPFADSVLILHMARSDQQRNIMDTYKFLVRRDGDGIIARQCQTQLGPVVALKEPWLGELRRRVLHKESLGESLE